MKAACAKKKTNPKGSIIQGTFLCTPENPAACASRYDTRQSQLQPKSWAMDSPR